MSRLQFRCTILILRHAWLNLWDKHMTTGRINQVAADVTSNEFEAGPGSGSTWVETRLRWFQSRASQWLWIAASDDVEQNASSHGFRTCLYHATRRRQGPVTNCSFRLGPAERALCCTNTVLNKLDFFRTPKIGKPDMLPTLLNGAVLWVRQVRGPNVRPESEGLKPSIHTTLSLSLWSGRARWAAVPIAREKSLCQEGGASAPRTRGTLSVSEMEPIFCFRSSKRLSILLFLEFSYPLFSKKKLSGALFTLKKI